MWVEVGKLNLRIKKRQLKLAPCAELSLNASKDL